MSNEQFAFYYGNLQSEYRNLPALVWGDYDPSLTATPGMTGQLFVRLGTLSVYQKQDDGVTTNWALTSLAPSAVTGNNTGSGAKILNLPFVGNVVSAKSLTPTTTALKDYIEITQGPTEIIFGFNSSKFLSDFPSLSLSVQGNTGVSKLNFVGATVVIGPADTATVTITPPPAQINVNSVSGITNLVFSGNLSAVQGPANTFTITVPSPPGVTGSVPIVVTGTGPWNVAFDPNSAPAITDADYSIFESISVIQQAGSVSKLSQQVSVTGYPRKYSEAYNDYGLNFATASIANNTFIGEGYYAASAGTGASFLGNQLPVDTNNFGIARFSTGTTATGRSGVIAYPTGIRIGEMNLVHDTFMRITSGLSTLAEEYAIRSGFIKNATTAGNIPVQDGVYFEYRDSGSTPNWQAICVNNNTVTQVDCGVPPSTASFQRLTIRVQRYTGVGEQAQFFINNILVATITLNIPANASGREVGIGQYIVKIVGLTARTFDSDYCYGLIERMKTGLR